MALGTNSKLNHILRSSECDYQYDTESNEVIVMSVKLHRNEENTEDDYIEESKINQGHITDNSLKIKLNRYMIVAIKTTLLNTLPIIDRLLHCISIGESFASKPKCYQHNTNYINR